MLTRQKSEIDGQDYVSSRQSIFGDFPIDLDLMVDLKYQFFDQVESDIEFYQRNLSLKEFLYIFPRFSTPITEAIDFANAVPESLIADLLSKRQTAAAYECSTVFGSEENFLQNFAGLVVKIVNSGGDIASLFDGCESLSPIVYSRLPSEFQILEMRFLFQMIESHSAHVKLSEMTDFEAYRKFLTVYPSFDCDQELLDYVHQEISRSIDILATLKWVARDFIGLFRQPRSAVGLICTQVFRRIDGATVDSMAAEDECLDVLRRSLIVLEAAKLRMGGFFDYELQLLEVNFLSRFVSRRIWANYQLAYSFRNFQDPNFLDSLIEICWRADMIDMLVDANTIWSTHIPSLKLHTLSTIIRLGCLDEGQTFLTKLSTRDCESPSELVQVLDLLSHPIPTNISFVPVDVERDVAFLSEHLDFAPDKKLQVPSLYTHSMALLRAKAGLSQQQIQMRSELLSLDREPGQIAFNSRHGDFAMAFDLWCRMRPEKRGFLTAIKWLFIPSISYGHWDLLWAYLKDNPPMRTEFGPILESLFESCHTQGMNQTLVSVQFGLDMLEDAIRAILNFLKADKTWEEQSTNLAMLQTVCEKEATARAAQPDGYVYKLTTSNLIRLLKLCGLQIRFMRLATEVNIPFTPVFNMVLYGNLIEEISALSLYHTRFLLGVQISELKPGSMQKIVMLLLDKLAGQKLIKYFQVMKQRSDARTYEYLCKELTKGLSRKPQNAGSIPKFVRKAVVGVPLQIQVLTECRYLPEALDLALSSQSTAEVMNIRAVAKEKGDAAIEKKCDKYLHK
jgi:hypothetical protein